MNPIRVLLADDNVIVRLGLKALLERGGIAVVGEAADGQEAIRLGQALQPDVAVLDLGMPVLNGLDAAQAIREASPETKPVLLAKLAEDHHVLRALRAGIRGYVVKTQAAGDLVQAIREVSQGRIYLSPAISQVVVKAYLNKSDLPPDPLTLRERQVVQLVAEGKTSKEIAQVLGVSAKTAESHRTRLMEKLSIHETAGLVRYAIRQGLIKP